MRIHSSILTGADHFAAADVAGVEFARCNRHRSQSRGTAFEVILEGSGRHGNQYGNSGTHGAAARQAALWDEWGIFLGELFRRDPAAFVGGGVYESGEHFRWVTGGRYDALTPAQVHRRHIWDQPRGERAATGAYFVSGCRCGAILRQVNAHGGYAWADISGGDDVVGDRLEDAARSVAAVASSIRGPVTQTPPVSHPGGRYASEGRYAAEYLAGAR